MPISRTNRRAFIAGLGGAAVWPMMGRAQIRKIPVVGVLWHAGSAEEEDIFLGTLRKGLAELGYVEGRTIILENRFPAEKPERFTVLAQELAALNPDVLVTVTPLAANAAQQATKTIPTVSIIYPNITKTKLIASLAHPGGNITGLSVDAGDLTAKRIEVLLDCVGRVSRMAILLGPPNPIQDLNLKRIREVTTDLNISIDNL